MATALPFLQHDDRWARKRIWNRSKVARAVGSRGKADDLLQAGTTIRQQGCQLCCIAMILALLDDGPWDPPTVLEEAREYIGLDGTSMVPLYADLCADLTQGKVQLFAKECFAGGDGPQPRLSQVGLVRAWRALPDSRRSAFVLMLRIGTFDETFASHYLLVAPRDGGVGSDDALVLDPDMPPGADAGAWSFFDAWDRFLDPSTDGGEKARLVDEEGVRRGQVAAVYLFGRRAREAYDAALGAFKG